MSVSPVSLGYKRKRGETPLRYPINHRGHHRGFVTGSNTHTYKEARRRRTRTEEEQEDGSSRSRYEIVI